MPAQSQRCVAASSLPRPNNQIVLDASSSLVKLLKGLAPDSLERITIKSTRIIKSLIELDHDRDAAEWAILYMIELGWMTPFVSIWGGAINSDRKTETPNHKNLSELFVERMLSQQDVTLVVEAVFWTDTVEPELQYQNENVLAQLSDAERRSLTERFRSIAEKFIRDIDSRKTKDFRVLGLPPALVNEMEEICSRLGIIDQNLPLKIEHGNANEIRTRLSEENVTDTTDLVIDGRCYTASPYGDALQDVLWHWVFESDDGSIMRHDIESEATSKHFADTLKRNLSEWIEYLKLKFAADRPTDDNNLGRHDSKARLSTVDGQDDNHMHVYDSKIAEVETTESRVTQILEDDAVKLAIEACKQSAKPFVVVNPHPPSPKTNPKRAGRKPVKKPTPDEIKIQQAWKSGIHPTHRDCDLALCLEIGTTKGTLDRLRKRNAKPKS